MDDCTIVHVKQKWFYFLVYNACVKSKIHYGHDVKRFTYDIDLYAVTLYNISYFTMITHIFKTAQPNRTRFSAYYLKFS